MTGYSFWCSKCRFDHAGGCAPSVPLPYSKPVGFDHLLPAGKLPCTNSPHAPWPVGALVASKPPTTGAIVFRVLGGLSRARYQSVEIVASKDWYFTTGKICDLSRDSTIGQYSQIVMKP